MRVYLDNCCYNRPFADQDQLKVRLETVTKLAVQLMMATEMKDRFDYTEWQKGLFKGETVRSLGEKMMAFKPQPA